MGTEICLLWLPFRFRHFFTFVNLIDNLLRSFAQYFLRNAPAKLLGVTVGSGHSRIDLAAAVQRANASPESQASRRFPVCQVAAVCVAIGTFTQRANGGATTPAESGQESPLGRHGSARVSVINAAKKRKPISFLPALNRQRTLAWRRQHRLKRQYKRNVCVQPQPFQTGGRQYRSVIRSGRIQRFADARVHIAADIQHPQVWAPRQQLGRPPPAACTNHSAFAKSEESGSPRLICLIEPRRPSRLCGCLSSASHNERICYIAPRRDCS
jgi:hypothetical protein